MNVSNVGLLILASIFLFACQTQVVKESEWTKKKLNPFEKLDADFLEAVKRTTVSSKWHQGYHQALPLHLIGPVFDHPDVVNSDVYQMLAISLRKISQNS